MLAAGAASSDEHKGQAAEFCGWERHTKAIGTKLMTAMGYVPGTGLGPKGDGLAEPIQALVAGLSSRSAGGRRSGSSTGWVLI